MRMRLDRWLATLCLGSRSEVRDWIRKGWISVNGAPERDPGASFETERDQLAVRGRRMDGRVMRHVMLNKPAGLLTAARDSRQPTVMELLPETFRGIGCMPVGRLDKDTTGLLLLTCDGELNHRLLSPGRHVDKVYRAEVTGRLTEADAEAFRAGLQLEDFTAMPAELRILQAGGATSLGEVTLREGKFHQVKRMFSVCGHEVLTLKRLRFGPLTLGEDLSEGEWRELTEEELRLLRAACGRAGVPPDRVKAGVITGNTTMLYLLTGRNPALFLQEVADYITEMRCVRHPYEKGIPARSGVEFTERRLPLPMPESL